MKSRRRQKTWSNSDYPVLINRLIDGLEPKAKPLTTAQGQSFKSLVEVLRFFKSSSYSDKEELRRILNIMVGDFYKNRDYLLPYFQKILPRITLSTLENIIYFTAPHLKRVLAKVKFEFRDPDIY